MNYNGSDIVLYDAIRTKYLEEQNFQQKSWSRELKFQDENFKGRIKKIDPGH